MKDSAELLVDYPGGIISVNSYKFRRTRGTLPFVKLWMKSLELKVKEEEIESFPYYTISIYGLFRDNRRPDMSNLFKVISDAIEAALKVNDKNFKLVDEGYETGHRIPKLRITIKGEANG